MVSNFATTSTSGESIIMSDGQEFQPSTFSAIVQLSQPCRQFQFQEIQAATHDFDESLVIGRGGSGKVYKGTIYNGSTPIAVKRLDSSSHGAFEFWAEVQMLSRLRHSHLVSLFGYCDHGKEMILVYEFMPNGALEDHLHKLGTPLSWLQRLEICIGAARGLDYLHTGTGIESGVIHGDVKSSNILLNEIWAAKIADFGLSRVTPRNQTLSGVHTLVKGTFGYIDPDYYNTGRLTRKSDVYAFGVVLLEVLCRKRAVDRSLDEDQWNLAIWAQESIKAGNLKSIIDYDIRGEISPKCLKESVRIAERCLLSNPKERPTMAEVMVSLESLQTLQIKVNSSLHPAVRTIFRRMVPKLPFSSNGETSAQVAKHNSRSAGELPIDYKINKLKEFEFVDLKRATSNFSEDLILGWGRFGPVFLGWVGKDTFAPSMLGVGMVVAVKRLDRDSKQGHERWKKQVDMLGRLAHPNIISLLGYCHHEHERLLVYEYMQKGSFGSFIWRELRGHIVEPLSWGARLTILIGVARGLSYLHSSKVIHRDVKSINILLDQDFNSKLGSFGLVRSGPEIDRTHVTTEVVGTHGYIDPYYISTGHLSVKSDIYSFGIVLLETVTGLWVRDAKQFLEQHCLVDSDSLIWADRSVLRKIMDPCLNQHYPEEGAFKCIELALRCFQYSPKDRPSSDDVLQCLEQIYAIDN